MLLRDAFRWFFDKTGVSRAWPRRVPAFSRVACSACPHPALASQLSPKEVRSYQRMQNQGAAALLGIGGKSVTYY
jgi:hypothetical protein